MTFVPKFQAVFEGPLIENLLAVIVRDFKECLDTFYPQDDLPDFAERAVGQEIGDEFPLLVIAPRSNPVQNVDDSSNLIQGATIDLHIGVIGDGPADVTLRLMRYVRCLDCVVRSASKVDWFAGLDRTRLMGFFVDVEHVYWPFGQNHSVLYRPATLTVTVQVRES